MREPVPHGPHGRAGNLPTRLTGYGERGDGSMIWLGPQESRTDDTTFIKEKSAS